MPLVTTELADTLATIQAQAMLPIVAGTTESDVRAALIALDRDRDDLDLLVVHLGGDDPDQRLERVLAGRGMRCGVRVDALDGAWTLTPVGACGHPRPELTVSAPPTGAAAGIAGPTAAAVEPAAVPTADATPTLLRVGAGAGLSNQFAAARLEAALEHWSEPAFGYGLRLHTGIDDAIFGDHYTRTGLEAYGTTRTPRDALHVVGQAGAGLAVGQLTEESSCLFGCTAGPASFPGPPMPVLTASVAGGITSHRGNVAGLIRAEADSNLAVAVWMGLEVGIRVRDRSR